MVGSGSHSYAFTANGITDLKNFITGGGGLLGFGSDTPGVLSSYYYYTGTGNITYVAPIALYANATGASGGVTAPEVATYLAPDVTGIITADPVVGSPNGGNPINIYVNGGPRFDEPLYSGASVVSYYNTTGNDAAIRFLYPNNTGAGHVLLAGYSAKNLCGSTWSGTSSGESANDMYDWSDSDNYYIGGNSSMTTDNPLPWTVFADYLHNWVADTVTPTVTSNADSNWHAAPATVTLTTVDTGGPGINYCQWGVGASPSTWYTATASGDGVIGRSTRASKARRSTLSAPMTWPAT